jgi:hypothetical protein
MNTKESSLNLLRTRVSISVKKLNTLELFQDVTSFINENFPEFSYTRRYSHVGPRTQRTKFFNTRVSSNKLNNIKKGVERHFPYISVKRINKDGLTSLVLSLDL